MPGWLIGWGRGWRWVASDRREPRQPLAPYGAALELVGELWTNFSFDPDGTFEQASADAAIAYTLNNNLQLDAGANLGPTADTPDLAFYAGPSLRF